MHSLRNSACSGVKCVGPGCRASAAAWSARTAKSGDLIAIAAAENLQHTATNSLGTMRICSGSPPSRTERHWVRKVLTACRLLSGTAAALQCRMKTMPSVCAAGFRTGSRSSSCGIAWISTSSCACRCWSSLPSWPAPDISSMEWTTCCSRPSMVAVLARYAVALGKVVARLAFAESSGAAVVCPCAALANARQGVWFANQQGTWTSGYEDWRRQTTASCDLQRLIEHATLML